MLLSSNSAFKIEFLCLLGSGLNDWELSNFLSVCGEVCLFFTFDDLSQLIRFVSCYDFLVGSCSFFLC